MVFPAPGYSLNDIISGIRFIAKAISALRENGGASSDYQQILNDVDYLEYILQDIQKATLTQTNASHFGLIRDKASELETILRDFVSSTNKYTGALGHQSRWSNEIPRKLQ